MSCESEELGLGGILEVTSESLAPIGAIWSKGYTIKCPQAKWEIEMSKESRYNPFYLLFSQFGLRYASEVFLCCEKTAKQA